MVAQSNYVPQWVNKIDVAVRHIRVAVRLHFEECEPVALHTLVAAAHSVVSDLGEHKGSPSRLGHNYDVRIAANFFKHADRDPEGRVNIEPLGWLTRDLLFDTVTTLQRIRGELPFEGQLYWAWYMVCERPDEFKDIGGATADVIASNRHLSTMSFSEIRQLMRFQQTLNTSEPLPAWALLGAGPLSSKSVTRDPTKDADQP